MNKQSRSTPPARDDAQGQEPFTLTDEMLESVVGGAAAPSPTASPIGKPGPLSVHNWDGNWQHI